MVKSQILIHGPVKSLQDHGRKILFVSFLALFLANCSSNRMNSSQPTSLEPIPASRPILEQGSATAPMMRAESEIEAKDAAAEIKASGARIIDHQIECPPDASAYISEFKVNTFEIGFRWNIPGSIQEVRPYSS